MKETVAMAAVDLNGAIGKKGDLIFKIPEDLARFRRFTRGKKLILGRKTLESFPGARPLPGRDHYVLSRGQHEEGEHLRYFSSPSLLAETIKRELESEKASGSVLPPAAKNSRELFDLEQPCPARICLIGGAEIYSLFLRECEFLELTEIEAEAEGADCFFPPYEAEFELIAASEWQRSSLEGLPRYRYLRYRRRRT